MWRSTRNNIRYDSLTSMIIRLIDLCTNDDSFRFNRTYLYNCYVSSMSFGSSRIHNGPIQSGALQFLPDRYATGNRDLMRKQSFARQFWISIKIYGRSEIKVSGIDVSFERKFSVYSVLIQILLIVKVHYYSSARSTIGTWKTRSMATTMAMLVGCSSEIGLISMQAHFIHNSF